MNSYLYIPDKLVRHTHLGRRHARPDVASECSVVGEQLLQARGGEVLQMRPGLCRQVELCRWRGCWAWGSVLGGATGGAGGRLSLWLGCLGLGRGTCVWRCMDVKKVCVCDSVIRPGSSRPGHFICLTWVGLSGRRFEFIKNPALNPFPTLSAPLGIARCRVQDYWDEQPLRELGHIHCICMEHGNSIEQC